MSTIEYSNMVLNSEIPITQVISMNVSVKNNKHAKIVLKGYLDSQHALDHIENQMLNKNICVNGRKADGTLVEPPLFNGVIQTFDVKNENGVYYTDITGISGSCNLDAQRCSRSFQDVSNTYEQVVKEVIKDVSHASVRFSVGTDRTIDKPLIQYNETNWDFIKRLASHFGSYVFPDCTSGKPYFWFGMPQSNQMRSFSENEYEIEMDERYQSLGGEASGIPKACFLYYVVKDSNNYEIGDKTKFLNKELMILEKTISFENGILSFYYKLGFEYAIATKEYYNRLFSGLSLNGTVVKTEKEVIHLQLDIDKEKTSVTYPYKWTPLTGNMMYCMPKVGTKASLYFSYYDERSGMVMNSPRENGATCNAMSDYNNRSFLTEHKKQMDLFPNLLALRGTSQAPTGLQITLEDEQYTKIESCKSIQLVAGSNIVFNAPEVIFTTPSQVLMHQNASMAALMRPLIVPVGSVRSTIQNGDTSNVKGDIALQAYNAGGNALFTLADRFDALGEHEVLMGWDYRIYSPFKDAPVVTEFNWFEAIAKAVAAVALVTLAAVLIGATGGVLAAVIIGAVVVTGIQVYCDYKDGNVSSFDVYLRKAICGAVAGAVSCFLPTFSANVFLNAGIVGSISCVAGTSAEHLYTKLSIWNTEDDDDIGILDYVGSAVGGFLGGMFGQLLNQVGSKAFTYVNNKILSRMFSKAVASNSSDDMITKWLGNATKHGEGGYQALCKQLKSQFDRGQGIQALTRWAKANPESFIALKQAFPGYKSVFLVIEKGMPENIVGGVIGGKSLDGMNYLKALAAQQTLESENQEQIHEEVDEFYGYLEAMSY